MGVCSSKSSASPASKKAAPLPAAGAKKATTASAPVQFHPAPPADDPNQLKFVPAKDDAHAVAAMGAKPPVELSVAAPPRAAAQPTSKSDAAARATSTARVEEVVLHTTKSSLPADDGGAAIRRAPPPAPTMDPSAETSADRKAEWARVRTLLPREKTPADKQRRVALFDEFDKDKSGALTYDEVHQGCVNILHLDHFTPHLHDITKRAFHKAKGMGTKDRGAGEEDKVEFLEFRLMLCYIYDYFELTVMFDEIDKDGSMMIDKDEFTSKAAPMLTKWGVPVHDADATFNEIDANESGIVTFEEFATWATEKKLQSSGDPDEGVASLPAPAPAAAAVSEAAPEPEPEPEVAKEEDAPPAMATRAVPEIHATLPPPPPPPQEDIAHDNTQDKTPLPTADPAVLQAQDEPSASTRKTEWARVRVLLPREKTPEDKQRRVALFDEFDKDKSGALTYDEVYKGCVNILHLNRFTSRLRDITKRAFHKAKGMGTKDRGAGEEDKVEFLEFRLMLCYIYDYFELTVMFDAIDKDGSMMIDKDEFTSKAAPMLTKWGVPVHDADATFNEIDANESGIVTFEEFATWATEKKLQSSGDPDEGVASLPAPAPAAPAVSEAAPEPEPEPEVAKEEDAPPAMATRAVPEIHATLPPPPPPPQEDIAHDNTQDKTPLPTADPAVLQAQDEPSASTRKTEWARVRVLLPREKTPEDKQRRVALFDEFDKDKSGALTYDEVYKGCVNILHLNRFTSRLRDITKRAFHKAKGMGTKDRGAGEEDKVEFLEFRLMLCYIYDYFELTVMFDAIDKDGSMMIDKDEFTSKAAPMLTKWGVPVRDADATFNEIDANGSKKITFAEFATWATEKKLDVDGDPDAEEAPTTSTPIAEDAHPITFSDDSDPVNDDDAAAEDEEEDVHAGGDDDDDGTDGDLDPRRVYGFDGDSTGLGAGAKEEGAMALDDDEELDDDSVKEMSSEDTEEHKEEDKEEKEKAPAAARHVDPVSEVPMVPVVVRAAKAQDVEMGNDDNNGVEAHPSNTLLGTSAPRAVSLEAAEEAPMVPVVVHATKNQEVEMGEAEGVEDHAISAPRAVSLEAAEQQPTPSQSTADAIQQNIIDDLFGDDAAAAQPQPPAPRRLPPPMPSPGEQSDKPDDEAGPFAAHEAHTSTNNDDGDAEIEEVVATPPPVRRAPPPMFSPPPPDADSEAENSVGAGVEAFYGRGTGDEAAPAPQDKADDAENEEEEDMDEL